MDETYFSIILVFGISRGEVAVDPVIWGYMSGLACSLLCKSVTSVWTPFFFEQAASGIALVLVTISGPYY